MGDRCNIYNEIDDLSSARTQPELVAKLQKILSALAYDSVAGDASALAYQESWRTQYTDALYEETGAAAAADSRGQSSRRESTPRPAPRAANPPREQPRPQPRQQARAQQAPPSNRPRAGDLPLSLQQIFQGTHPTLTETD